MDWFWVAFGGALGASGRYAMSLWLSKPQLVEIVAASLGTGNRDQKRVSNFTMRATLSRPTTQASTAGGTGTGTVINAPGKV